MQKYRENILKQTIENTYNEENFKKFISELLNGYNLLSHPLTPYYSSEYINNFNLLGEDEDNEGNKVHILEVELKTPHKLEYARTAQRNLIAKYLEDNWLDGALVSFYAPNYPHWRFSFVEIAWEFDEKNKKTKKVLSPARRYSFLIGEGEPSHTAQSQLSPLLEQGEAPILRQIEETFSIEKVTKEFFKEYKNLFDMLIKELNNNHSFKIQAAKSNINTENFAKILLGQIIFLYFLQKKGWLGVPSNKTWGEGDKYFLRHLFKKSRNESKNFFNFSGNSPSVKVGMRADSR